MMLVVQRSYSDPIKETVQQSHLQPSKLIVPVGKMEVMAAVAHLPMLVEEVATLLDE